MAEQILTPAETYVGNRLIRKLRGALHLTNEAKFAARALTPDVLAGLNTSEAIAAIEQTLQELRTLIAHDKTDEAAASAHTALLPAQPHRFYIASSLDNAAAVQRLARMLISKGNIWTYDWTTHGSVYRPDATPEENATAFREAAAKELDGVATADIVIVLFPGGRGTHIELGAALALGKRILLVRDTKEAEKDERCPAFYRLCGQVLGSSENSRTLGVLNVPIEPPLYPGASRG